MIFTKRGKLWRLDEHLDCQINIRWTRRCGDGGASKSHRASAAATTHRRGTSADGGTRRSTFSRANIRRSTHCRGCRAACHGIRTTRQAEKGGGKDEASHLRDCEEAKYCDGRGRCKGCARARRRKRQRLRRRPPTPLRSVRRWRLRQKSANARRGSVRSMARRQCSRRWPFSQPIAFASCDPSATRRLARIYRR